MRDVIKVKFLFVVLGKYAYPVKPFAYPVK